MFKLQNWLKNYQIKLAIMKNYLFFSRTDKIGIAFLSAIVVIILLINITISRSRENINLFNTINKQPNGNNIVNNTLTDTVTYNTDTKSFNNKKATTDHQSQKKDVNTRKQVQAQQQTSTFIIELNSADSAELTLLNGIGPVFASRIVKYRQKLGGFICKEQLLEVYGLKPEVMEKIKDNVKVDANLITPIKINSATFKDIIRHPYYCYDTTLIIVRARDKMTFTSIEDFKHRTNIQEKKKLAYISIE